MKLFIDTNIYLKFYHFSNDDLEELRKLTVLIDESKIELLLPIQVINEFRRNREVKIADALTKINEEKLTNNFPIFCKEYAEFQEMKNAISTYQTNKTKLIDKLKDSTENYNLKADLVINELFSKATRIDFDDKIIQKAKLRYNLGNPPGKNNSYGDAINWENLLIEVNYNEDLYFLSDDKDYYSQIDNNKFNKYLELEWKEIKNSKIYFYRSISNFFKDKYPDIKLASELKKDIRINNLENSKETAEAQLNIIKLLNFEDFNSTQINSIFKILFDNDHVFSVVNNENYFNKILFEWFNKYSENIDEDIKNSFLKKINRIDDNYLDKFSLDKVL